MAGFLRTIAQGIGSGLNRMAVGSTGGLLKPGEPGSRERRQNIGAGLSDIGYLISSRGLGGSPYSQQLAGNRQAEQQALAAQQKERQALEIQAKRQEIANQPGKTPAQIAQELAMFEASIGNAAAATAAGGLAEKFAPPEVKAPEIIDPSLLVNTPEGLGFFTADRKFQRVETTVIPDSKFERVKQADGSEIAVDMSKVADGQVLAKAGAAQKPVQVIDGVPWVYDPETNKATPWVNGVTGKPFEKPPPPRDPYAALDRQRQLRLDYSKDVDTAVDTALNISKLHGIINSGTPVSDLAATSIFNRILEPDSVTREAEAGMTREARSAWESLKVYAGRINEGRTLTKAQVDDMLVQAQKASQGLMAYYEEKRREYARRSSDYGVDSSDVIGRDIREVIGMNKGGVSDEEFDSLFK